LALVVAMGLLAVIVVVVVVGRGVLLEVWG
jgi:hypothetical protein